MQLLQGKRSMPAANLGKFHIALHEV